MASAISRAIWAFIVLSGAAILAVAATDHAMAWEALTAPGFAGIAAVSLVLGWLLRRRRKPEAAEPLPEQPAETPEPPASLPLRREPALSSGAKRPVPNVDWSGPKRRPPDPFDRLAGEPKKPAPVFTRDTGGKSTERPGPDGAEPPADR